MKIAIDARESGTSTGRYIDKLVENLQKVDQVNEYLVLVPQHRIGQVLISSANFQLIQCDYKEFTFAEQLGFARFLYKLKADLVHFGMIQQPLLYMRPSVTTMHDLTTVRFRNPNKSRLWYWFKLPPYWLVINIVARRAKAILTPTHYVLNDLCSFTKHTPKLGKVTYESADAITAEAEPIKELMGKEFIMYVGRHTTHKNLQRLIKAHQKLRATRPNVLLVIAGKKDTATEKLLADVADPSSIVLTGFVSEGQLRWLYEHCAAYIFPSLSEGFGLPGLEAMKHGAPVVSSNATCLPEVYGDAAEYFDPLDVDDISRKILNVLTNPKVGDNLRDKGYKKAKEYSWQKMAEETVDIYQSALPR